MLPYTLIQDLIMYSNPMNYKTRFGLYRAACSVVDGSSRLGRIGTGRAWWLQNAITYCSEAFPDLLPQIRQLCADASPKSTDQLIPIGESFSISPVKSAKPSNIINLKALFLAKQAQNKSKKTATSAKKYNVFSLRRYKKELFKARYVEQQQKKTKAKPQPQGKKLNISLIERNHLTAHDKKLIRFCIETGQNTCKSPRKSCFITQKLDNNMLEGHIVDQADGNRKNRFKIKYRYRGKKVAHPDT